MPFTAPTTTTAFTVTENNWTDSDSWEELRLAVSERNKAAGNSWRGYWWSDDGPPDYNPIENTYEWYNSAGFSDSMSLYWNDDAPYSLHDLVFWAEVHSIIKNVYSDYAKGDPDYFTDNSIPPWDSGWKIGFADWLDFCKYVGGNLYTSDTDYGFRKATRSGDDVSWGRGSAEAGDYVGYHLMEDAIACCKAMAYFYEAADPDDGQSIYEINTTMFDDSGTNKVTMDTQSYSATTMLVNDGQTEEYTFDCDVSTGGSFHYKSIIDGGPGFDHEVLIEWIPSTTGEGSSRMWVTEDGSKTEYSGEWLLCDRFTFDFEVPEISLGSGVTSITAGKITITGFAFSGSDPASPIVINLSASTSVDTIRNWTVLTYDTSSTATIFERSSNATTSTSSDSEAIAQKTTTADAPTRFYVGCSWFETPIDIPTNEYTIKPDLAWGFSRNFSAGNPSTGTLVGIFSNLAPDAWETVALAATDTEFSGGWNTLPAADATLTAGQKELLAAYTMKVTFTNGAV